MHGVSLMEIRKYKDGDSFDAISRVYAMSWKTAYRQLVPDDYLHNLTATRWVPLLRKECANLLLALEHDKIIGVSTYGAAQEKSYAGWGEVISLYLLPDCIRKGIGSRLLQCARKELADVGYQQVYLWVLKENEAARCFYEANGFHCNGDIITCEIGGKSLEEIRYVYDHGKR
jgi:GNAT superfamily N-acetyltransferase